MQTYCGGPISRQLGDRLAAEGLRFTPLFGTLVISYTDVSLTILSQLTASQNRDWGTHPRDAGPRQIGPFRLGVLQHLATYRRVVGTAGGHAGNLRAHRLRMYLPLTTWCRVP